MGKQQAPTFHLVIREGADGAPHYEVKWKSRTQPGKQMKRRLGEAWLTRSRDGAWGPRKGRPRDGALDERAATVRASETVTRIEASLTAEAKEAARLAVVPLTFRAIAHEWLTDLESRQGAKPSTIANYRMYLREPGEPHKRGERKSPGRIMATFGDRDIREITAKDIGRFLRCLDAEGMSPRSVNAHRQVLSCVFTFACREDTHALEKHPVLAVASRREPPPASLDFYEVEEVERLAQALHDGLHRKSTEVDHNEGELLARVVDDVRDANLVRFLLYTGLRASEALALRWRETDLDAQVIIVRRNVSAGTIVDSPKGGSTRVVALAQVAVELLRTMRNRPDFTLQDDLVFAGRLGERMDISSFRKRYKAAARAAGLRPVKLHGLRHASGSLLARHASPAQVSGHLGHRKLATTDRYVHARVTDGLRASLDAAFPGSK